MQKYGKIWNRNPNNSDFIPIVAASLLSVNVDPETSVSAVARNHTVQYFSYPRYKFDRLRREAPGMYETYADVGLNEWKHFRLVVGGERVSLHLNRQKNPSFVVNGLKVSTARGSIGLWVDIGTVGYFKDISVVCR